MKYIVDNKHDFYEFYIFNKPKTITRIGNSNSLSFTKAVDYDGPYRVNYTMHGAYYSWNNRGYNNDMSFLAKATPISEQRMSDFADKRKNNAN